MARNKGDKDYTKSEKQLLISLIYDYSLFGATDSEIIQMLSIRQARKYQKLFSTAWRKKLKEKEEILKHGLIPLLDINTLNIIEKGRAEYVQQKLLEALVDEIEKPKDKKNKTLINQLSKSIADNSKVLLNLVMPHLYYPR